MKELYNSIGVYIFWIWKIAHDLFTFKIQYKLSQNVKLNIIYPQISDLGCQYLYIYTHGLQRPYSQYIKKITMILFFLLLVMIMRWVWRGFKKAHILVQTLLCFMQVGVARPIYVYFFLWALALGNITASLINEKQVLFNHKSCLFRGIREKVGQSLMNISAGILNFFVWCVHCVFLIYFFHLVRRNKE